MIAVRREVQGRLMVRPPSPAERGGVAGFPRRNRGSQISGFFPATRKNTVRGDRSAISIGEEIDLRVLRRSVDEVHARDGRLEIRPDAVPGQDIRAGSYPRSPGPGHSDARCAFCRRNRPQTFFGGFSGLPHRCAGSPSSRKLSPVWARRSSRRRGQDRGSCESPPQASTGKG